LNAADEVAVEAFLQGRIGFLEIAEVVEETLSQLPGREARTIGDVLEIDKESRLLASGLVTSRAAAGRAGARA
jgi:1-deoxy-D-xylulose-5-phosphate reductoisomerase